MSFERTLPKQLVHRTALSEVLLTSCTRNGEDRFQVCAQLPRTHVFYQPIAGQVDPLLFAEAIRQAALAVPHVEFGVPQGHQFVLESLSYDLLPGGLELNGLPVPLVLGMVYRSTAWRGDVLSAFDVEVRAWRGGELAGTGRLVGRCMSPAAYARLRSRSANRRLDGARPRLPEPREPADRPVSDRVVRPGSKPGSWLFTPDLRHPILFDHPVDHLPGMVILEGIRQAARQWRGGNGFLPLSLRASFRRYVDLDTGAQVCLDPARSGPDTVTAVVRQAGEVAAEATLGIGC